MSCDFILATDRVVDEMNPDVHFSRGQLENLLKNEVQYTLCIIFHMHCVSFSTHIM